MDFLYIGIVFLFATLGFVGLLQYHMHMFQLNSYAADEQLRWMKKNYNSLLGRIMGVLLCLGILAISRGWFAGILCGILLWLTYRGNHPVKGMAKRDFVYTKRVVRMLVTTGILYALCLAVGIVLAVQEPDRFVVYLPVLLACIMVQWLIFLANLINRPLERHINRSFVEDAKKKVAEMPVLTTIGITGSYGKTSMKHFVTKLLAADYNAYMTPGNYNTELGVTIAVRRDLTPLHEVFVCEMGARRVGEIQAVCNIVAPKQGVLTSVGAQHLETFGSMENILNTKLELAHSVPTDGVLFVNYDDPTLRKQTFDKKVISYAVDCLEAMYRPQNISVSEKGCSFDVVFPGGETAHFETKLIGAHNVLNLAGAIAVADYWKVPVSHMVTQVRHLEPVPHRLQLRNTRRGIIIDDAYNSNPAGAKAALDTLEMFEGVRFLVTPGMVELGEKQAELNFRFGCQAAEAADVIILVGKKQTEPIYEGICSTKFPKERLFVVSDLQEAMARVDAYPARDQKKIVLLENDLPDNY